MNNQVFINAYARMFSLHERAVLAGNMGLYDAAAFYMRKTLEVIADSFLTSYAQMGNAWMFDNYCHSVGHFKPSLDDKIDFLLRQNNIPQSSRETYDAIRMYGNAAVHKVDFNENPTQHVRMMNLLANEMSAYHIMAYGQ